MLQNNAFVLILPKQVFIEPLPSVKQCLDPKDESVHKTDSASSHEAERC